MKVVYEIALSDFSWIFFGFLVGITLVLYWFILFGPLRTIGIIGKSLGVVFASLWGAYGTSGLFNHLSAIHKYESGEVLTVAGEVKGLSYRNHSQIIVLNSGLIKSPTSKSSCYSSPLIEDLGISVSNTVRISHVEGIFADKTEHCVVKIELSDK